MNGTSRSQADRVAARVQALLAGSDAPEPSDARNVSDGPDGFGGGAEPDRDIDAVGDRPEGTERHRPARTEPTWWDRLSARVPVRLDPGHRGALAVGVAVLVAALITGAWLVSSRPQAVPVSATVPSVPGAGPLVGTDGVTEGASAAPTGPAVSVATTGAAGARVVVDVAGKVRHPGVYRLPPGSRVDDALTAAGGTRGHVDLSKLNLAALLVDGQQVAVGVAPVVGGGAVGGAVPAGSGDAGGSSATIVELNTATLEQLETLPGVGPVLGQDILDYRDAHGAFTSTDQLKNVSGIGDVTFDDLKSLVTV